MQIAIYGKTIQPEQYEYFTLLLNRILSFQVSIWKPFSDFLKDKNLLPEPIPTFETGDELNPGMDFMFSVGGDGTLLGAVNLVRDKGIPIVGINLGRMGFLSTVRREEILPAMDALFAGQFHLEPRSLIELLHFENPFEGFPCGLNELAINKKETSSMVLLHIWINEVFLHSYWADGLIVATPTGSTAYSLSCNGPILIPTAKNFVLSPIAPHNLTARPVVIPDDSKIRIRVETREPNALVCIDGRNTEISSGTDLEIVKAGFVVNLVQANEGSFFSTLRSKLNWGFDIRNY